jgi:tyrosine decarboxylase / aspartate 1-decarboxylase
LRGDARFEPLAAGAPELDIVVWKLKAETPEKASALAQTIFSACAGRNLHLALVQLPQFWFGSAGSREQLVTCLRSVLMKPEHEAWLDRIWTELCGACSEVENG